MNAGRPVPSRPHLATIDGLRFGCAAAVLAYHVGMVFPLASSSATRLFGTIALPTGAARWTAWGWVGVEIFFVLSGYVIATSVGAVDRAAFARARLLRLFPAGIVCATITATVLAASGALPPAQVAQRWFATLTMLPFGPRIDGVWWTLQVEVCFYLVVAAVLRGCIHDSARIERLGRMLALWSGVYWLAIVGSAQSIDAIANPLRLLLLPHGGLFALGIALHALTLRITSTRIACAILALVAALAEVAMRATLADGAAGVATPPAVPILAFLAAVTLIAAAPALDRHIRARPLLARLGRITYPLYLVNQVVGAATIVLLVRIGLPPAPAMIGSAVAMLALADAIARGPEPAIRRHIAAALSPARAPRPDTLPSASLPAG